MAADGGDLDPRALAQVLHLLSCALAPDSALQRQAADALEAARGDARLAAYLSHVLARGAPGAPPAARAMAGLALKRVLEADGGALAADAASPVGARVRADALAALGGGDGDLSRVAANVVATLLRGGGFAAWPALPGALGALLAAGGAPAHAAAAVVKMAAEDAGDDAASESDAPSAAFFGAAVPALLPHLGSPDRALKAAAAAAVARTVRDAPLRVELSIARARRDGFLFGAKLVRGAYMAQERARAAALGYADPIHATLADTHACYHGLAERVLDAVVAPRGGEVMVASHNEGTVTRVAAGMAARGLAPATCGVSFGQLLGMCDATTLSLGRAGYAAFKYVPYGPVLAVMPYLIRRAQENSDVVAGGVGKELAQLRGELRKRLVGV